MTLIKGSLVLSLGVLVRMIVPVIAIGIASTIIFGLLNIPTAGRASYIGGPVTAVFVSLYGIRAALELNGDVRRPDLSILILKSVLYGIFFLVRVGGLIWFANLAAVLFANWYVGEPISMVRIKNVSKSIQLGFPLLAVGSKIIVLAAVLAAANTIMAVPLASAAREAGRGAPSKGFFFGAGRSFLPLFCIFFVSYSLHYHLELISLCFALLPIIVSVVSIIFTQTLPEFDLEFILSGVAALAGLLWLHSWMWSASALALIKFDGGPTATRTPAPSEQAVSSSDIRALHKSPGQSF